VVWLGIKASIVFRAWKWERNTLERKEGRNGRQCHVLCASTDLWAWQARSSFFVGILIIFHWLLSVKKKVEPIIQQKVSRSRSEKRVLVRRRSAMGGGKGGVCRYALCVQMLERGGGRWGGRGCGGGGLVRENAGGRDDEIGS
jgi:hypothetical protein